MQFCFMDISNSIECHEQFEFFHDFCLRTYNIDSLCLLCFCHTFLYAPIKDKDLLYLHAYIIFKTFKASEKYMYFYGNSPSICVLCIVKVMCFVFLAVVEILDSDSESDDPIYKFKFDIEDLITSTLNEFGGPERDEESPQMTETLNDLNGQIKGIESKLLLQNTLKLPKEVYFK